MMDLNPKPELMNKAIKEAAEAGDLKRLKFLIDKQKIGTKNDKYNAFCIAMMHGYGDITDYLFNEHDVCDQRHKHYNHYKK
jgi:hypothetical protein